MLHATGKTFDDIGGSLSWEAAGAVFANITPDTACGRLLVPERAAWSTTEKTNDILADIFDILSTINANLVALGSGKKAHQPQPYPRPGKPNKKNNKSGEVRHIGSGALPPDELRAWFEVKRAEAQLRQSHTV